MHRIPRHIFLRSVARLSRSQSPKILLTSITAPATTAAAAFSTNATTNTNAKCPFTGKASNQRGHSTLEAPLQDTTSTKVHPELKDVPNVPILGIFVSAVPWIGNFLNTHFYQNPVMGPDNAYDFQYALYEKYGTFYASYIPGLGEGLYPKVYMVMDPHEMKKVIRQEGAFPRGGVEGLKPMTKWMKKNHFAIAGGSSGEDAGFMGRGETW